MKSDGKKVILGLSAVVILVFVLAYYGFSQSIYPESECSPFDINAGENYYGIVLEGEYLVQGIPSTNFYYQEVETKQSFLSEEQAVTTLNNLLKDKGWNGGLKVEILECTATGSYPLRCNNYSYANCIELSYQNLKDKYSIEDPVENPVEEPIGEADCNINSDCSAYCGSKTPTCQIGACFCDNDKILITVEQTPYYLYLIPITIFGLVAFIVWMRIKKPKRRK